MQATFCQTGFAFTQNFIDRLEEVSRQITAQCNSLYKTQLGAMRSCLGGIAGESYYRAIFNIQQRTGLGFSFAMFPKSQVEQLLSKHWCGASYSQRLWRDTDILADRLKDELLIGLLSGRSGEKTARVIREQFGNNAYCARRLVRTESAYVCNAAALSGYGEAGIERYIFVATLDQKTSEVCEELDGQSFLRSEAKAGTNLPPMHPFCRSTTIADFGENTLKNLERRAKDKDGNTVTVPADMKYSEWREKFVDGNSGGIRLQGLTNGAEDGIIKAVNRRASNSGAFEELPERMSKKHIREIAKKFDFDISGLTLNIDTNEELLRMPFAGEAVPEQVGKITFFPNAFRSEEELLRTLVHESVHVKQFKDYGAEYVQNHLDEFEKLAYSEEKAFIDRLKKEGKL